MLDRMQYILYVLYCCRQCCSSPYFKVFISVQYGIHDALAIAPIVVQVMIITIITVHEQAVSLRKQQELEIKG